MSGPVYQFDDFQLDCGRFQLTRNGRSVPVERKPMELLLLLVERSGQLLTRAEIAERLWEREVFVDTEHGINTAIRKIRLTLRDNAGEPRFVETVMGKGYRFVAPVALQASHEADPLPDDPCAGAATIAPAVEVDPAAMTDAPPAGISLEGIPKDRRDGLARWRRPAWVIGGVVLAAAAAGLTSASWVHRQTASETGIRSLAVLPLDNLSGAHEQDYLADSFTDELTTMLAKNSTLRVTSRTSMMQYKGAHRPLRQIAEELGVDAILAGSVVRSGDKMHMTIQLIQSRTDSHLWAESYDRGVNDVVALPREAAEAIARKLKSSVPPQPPARYVNPKAHDAYVHGRYLWTTFDLEEAHKYMRKAVELQPDYALGWSGLADYYGVAAASESLDPREALPQEEAAAIKALQLDDSLAEAHLSMSATYFFCRWDWAAADREILRAIELDPKFAEAHYFRAIMLMALNRHQEAIESEKKALEIDPFGRPSALGDFYNEAREYDAALKDAFDRLQSTPNNIALLLTVADAYWFKGMFKESVQFSEKADELNGDKESAAGIRRAYRQGGAKGVTKWRLSVLHKLAATHYVSPMYQATLYAGLGEREKTFALLEEAFRQRAPGLLFHLQGNPSFDFLRADRRYRSLIQRIGLPPPA